MNKDILEKAATAAEELLSSARPRCAVILGSGWGDVVEALGVEKSVPYSAVPGLGTTRVAGHSGRLHLARCAGNEILVFQGRRHWYEGEGWEPVALPVYLSVRLGVSILLLTNAAGGIRADLRPGDLMVVDDHINATGGNPLAGPHDPAWGPRFPDQTEVYDKGLRDAMDGAAIAVSQRLHHGVYLAASGPTYETPAEIAAFRAMGADAVGMSTVPEAMLAHAAGLRVAAVSCISNAAAGVSASPLAHEEVIATARKTAPRMARLVVEFLGRV